MTWFSTVDWLATDLRQNKRAMTNLPLLGLFYELRRAGLPLGIVEYELALRALGVIAPKTLVELKRLCSALWVKSNVEERILDYHFERAMPEMVDALRLSAMGANQTESAPPIRGIVAEPESGDSDSLPTSSPGNDRAPAELARQRPSGSQSGAGISEALVEEDGPSAEGYISVGPADRLDDLMESELASGSRPRTTEVYYPVTHRELKQAWRHLRVQRREGVPIELDMDATVARLARDGVLVAPVLTPSRVNRISLIVLIDRLGSMIPFHGLAQRIVETATRGGRIGRAGVYYFHNCPRQDVYVDMFLHQEIPVEDILTRTRLTEKGSMLIISDAGAARGRYSVDRLDETLTFLHSVRDKVRNIAWLNPVPRLRWDVTPAFQIASEVPMFETTRAGVDLAMDALRGRFLSSRLHSL